MCCFLFSVIGFYFSSNKSSLIDNEYPNTFVDKKGISIVEKNLKESSSFKIKDSIVLVYDDSLIKKNPIIDKISSKTKEKYIYDQDVNIIHHKYYDFLYSEEHEQPFWVKYISTKQHIQNKKYKRKNNFREDPMVQTQSATLIDYVKGGYDRGHLCPAGDMSFSMEAMSESFYMSNMSPQSPSFNRGKWKSLEEKARKWSVKYDSAIIYCGGVLSNISKSIGPNKVSVPNYYYKVIYCPTINNAVGFIMPNKKCEKSLSSYMVSIDSVESLTKIDFYNQYFPEVQKSFESNFTVKYWF